MHEELTAVPHEDTKDGTVTEIHQIKGPSSVSLLDSVVEASRIESQIYKMAMDKMIDYELPKPLPQNAVDKVKRPKTQQNVGKTKTRISTKKMSGGIGN